MPQENKDRIISLIKDDLIHTKLLNGLDALGLETADYMLRLSDTILQEMGFDAAMCEAHPVIDRYLAWTHKATGRDIQALRGVLDMVANHLYEKLLRYHTSLTKAHRKRTSVAIPGRRKSATLRGSNL